MSTEEQRVDPQAVEETKQQIRGLVEEITRLSKQELAPEVFYGEFLQRVVSALAAIGGAVWLLSEEGPLRLMYQINLRESLPEDQGEDHARHARLLHRVVRNGDELLVPPYSGAEGDDEAGNPTAYLLVLAPLRSGERNVGVVEIFQRPTSGPASQRGYLRFLSQMCSIVAEYLKGRRLQQLSDTQSVFSKADQFARSVHETLDPRTTAYTVANEGRRLIGCDRVSVALRRGNRCVVEAVSGQDTMDARANTVVLLGKLATAVVRNGEPLWYTGPTDELPPQIESAVQEYIDECHSKSVGVIPLFRPLDPDHDFELSEQKRRKDPISVAALIVEQIEDSRPREEFAQTLELVTEHSSRAISNAMEHNNLFLMPVWRSIGRAKWIVQARTLPKTLAIGGTVLFALLFMFLCPWNFGVEGSAQLRPTERREVSADVDGTITNVYVEQGQTVAAGDELLALRNTQLEIQREDLLGKRSQAGKELVAAQRNMFLNTNRRMSAADRNAAKSKFSGEIAILQKRLDTYDKELELLDEQMKGLVVKSPIDGQIVTTWNVLEQLRQRSVTKGQILITVADPNSEWEMEVFMPEKSMGHVARAANRAREAGEDLEVKFVVSNEPETKHTGTVKQIAEAAELHDEYGHCVPIRVKINRSDIKDPRIGIEATAKVQCGRRSVGYVWFHELFEFIQSRVLF